MKKRRELFWEKVAFSIDGCWEWLAGCSGGYGQFRDGQRRVVAHRFAYEDLLEKIPLGLELDHLCKNKKCVNPKHLEPVTRKENRERGNLGVLTHFNRLKTHCPYGHPYNKDNTYIYTEARGGKGRLCLTCVRKRGRK